VTKGTLVMPSLVAACRQGYSNPDVFDPDRFDPAGRDEGTSCQANFLAFGVGAHYCVGREYAMNHLIAFMALVCTGFDWERTRDGK
jgi:cytochrome P450 family 710 subfamily A protein